MKCAIKQYFFQTLIIVLVGGIGYLLFHPELWFSQTDEEIKPPTTSEELTGGNVDQYYKIDPAHRVAPVYASSIDNRPRIPVALDSYGGKLYVAFHQLNMIDVLDVSGKRQTFFDAYPQGPLQIGVLSFGDSGNFYAVDFKSKKILAYDTDLQFTGFFPAASSGSSENVKVRMPVSLSIRRGLAFVVDFGANAVKSFLANGEYVFSITNKEIDKDSKWHPISALQTKDGRVLVADILNKKITAYSCAGSFAYHFADAEGDAQLTAPGSMVMDGMGRVHVIDSKLNVIFVYNSYGRFLFTYGLQAENGMLSPTDGITVDSINNQIFLADKANRQIEIWKY